MSGRRLGALRRTVPFICASQPGFDRAAFQRLIWSEVLKSYFDYFPHRLLVTGLQPRRERS